MSEGGEGAKPQAKKTRLPEAGPDKVGKMTWKMHKNIQNLPDDLGDAIFKHEDIDDAAIAGVPGSNIEAAASHGKVEKLAKESSK